MISREDCQGGDKIPQECLETKKAESNHATGAALFDRHPQHFPTSLPIFFTNIVLRHKAPLHLLQQEI